MSSERAVETQAYHRSRLNERSSADKYKLGARVRMLVCVLTAAAALGGCADFPEFPVGTASSHTRSRLDFGDDLTREGKLAEAESVFYQVAATAPAQSHKMEALQKLGDIYLRQNNTNRAMATFRELLLLDPRNKQGMTGLGIALNLSNRPQEAERYLREAVKLGEERALSPLGVALDLQNRYAEAQEIYLAGLKRRPDGKELLANLALSYALSGDVASAQRSISQVTQLLFVPGRYKRNHVFILALSGKTHEAGMIGKSLGLPKAEIDSALEIAAIVKKIPAAQRGAYMNRLLL
jgi:Flp pilus assembly protein TadD